MYITKKFGSSFGLWVQRYNNILNNRICFNKKQSKYQNVLIFRLFLVFVPFVAFLRTRLPCPLLLVAVVVRHVVGDDH